MPQLKLEEGTVPPEVLENLSVRQDDFIAAHKRVQPSAMREIMVQMPDVRWDDVGGVDEARDKLREGVEQPLKNAAAFHRLGIRPAKGFLLFGPPARARRLQPRRWRAKPRQIYSPSIRPTFFTIRLCKAAN